MLKDIFGFIGTYGLPTVLLILVGWLYERARTKWDLERAELYKAWQTERAQLLDDRAKEWESRAEDAEQYSERLMKMQEIQLNVVNKTSEMLAQSNQRERELRDDIKEKERAFSGPTRSR